MKQSRGIKPIAYSAPVYIVGTYDAEGKLDVTKIKPLIWAPDDRGYYGIGEKLGDAFAIGRPLMNDQTEG